MDTATLNANILDFEDRGVAASLLGDQMRPDFNPLSPGIMFLVFSGTAFVYEPPQDLLSRYPNIPPPLQASIPTTDLEASALELKFNALANEWKSVVGSSSLAGRIVSHPAYLEIISHGEKMLPYVLRDLQKEPNHWFVALYIIAGRFSPVKPEDKGNIRKMTEAWLEWGRRNGKLK